MQQQKDLFDAFAKASTVLHLSADESSRALLALEQMFSKGKIQAQELRLQLGQAIPGAAERFQQAVLQMTKGTDLQGKSFDQLLQSGALVTDRFIPALIESFAGVSTGWQEASDSLNSNIGRLQTAWFDLKVAVTDGPFN
jgi:tape measure domain-containing protein